MSKKTTVSLFNTHKIIKYLKFDTGFRLCYIMLYERIGFMNIFSLNIKQMTFPEQVKYVRMVLGITQTELAEKCGISYATVSRWERENRTPQISMLGKFYSFCLRNGFEVNTEEKGGAV